jgi:hypothetical protein
VISASNKEASSDGSANHAAAGNGPSPTIADELPEPLTAEPLAADWDADRPPSAGPLANVAAAVATAALGAAGLAMSVAMGLGSPEKPEPGLWPFIISLVMIAMSAALLVFGRKKLDAEAFSGSSWQVAGGVATLVGFVLVVGVAGFEIPTLLLTFVWLRFLGKETWRMSIILSLAVTAAFYLIFVVALSVPIPHLF